MRGVLQLSIIITCLIYTPSVRKYKPAHNFTPFFSVGDSKKMFDKETYRLGGYVPPMLKWDL